jgi:hypothetical protein
MVWDERRFAQYVVGEKAAPGALPEIEGVQSAGQRFYIDVKLAVLHQKRASLSSIQDTVRRPDGRRKLALAEHGAQVK